MRSWLLALLGCAWTAIAALAGPARAGEPSWLPLAPGNRWVYDVHRDHSYRPANATIDRVFHRGRFTQSAQPANVDGAVELRELLVLRPVQGGSEEGRTSWAVLSGAGELRMLASGLGETRATGGGREAVYRPPLRMLPAAVAPGDSWQVGILRDGELAIDLRAEAVGIGDHADPACSACLEVRYRGEISGTIPVYQGSAAVESGRYERVAWFQRGVGIVRDVSTVTAALRLPDGTSAEVEYQMTLRLVEHRLSK